MQRNIRKIVSEIVPVLDAVVFSRLCAINICAKKSYIKKSFCSGLSLIVVVVCLQILLLFCFSSKIRFCGHKRSENFKILNFL